MIKRLLVSVLLMLSLACVSVAVEQPNMPAAFDMIMQAGADYILSIQIKNSEGVLVDMVSKNYAAQFRAAAAPSGVLYANFSTVKRIPTLTESVQVQFTNYSTSSIDPFETYSSTRYRTEDRTIFFPAVLDIKLSKDQTRALSGRAGVWDLKQTDYTGLVSYILTGRATVRPTVTQ